MNNFNFKRVTFLGFKISLDGIRTIKDNTGMILVLPNPKNLSLIKI